MRSECEIVDVSAQHLVGALTVFSPPYPCPKLREKRSKVSIHPSCLLKGKATRKGWAGWGRGVGHQGSSAGRVGENGGPSRKTPSRLEVRPRGEGVGRRPSAPLSGCLGAPSSGENGDDASGQGGCRTEVLAGGPAGHICYRVRSGPVGNLWVMVSR